jgi:hypothetical protein
MLYRTCPSASELQEIIGVVESQFRGSGQSDSEEACRDERVFLDQHRDCAHTRGHDQPGRELVAVF